MDTYHTIYANDKKVAKVVSTLVESEEYRNLHVLGPLTKGWTVNALMNAVFLERAYGNPTTESNDAGESIATWEKVPPFSRLDRKLRKLASDDTLIGSSTIGKLSIKQLVNAHNGSARASVSMVLSCNGCPEFFDHVANTPYLNAKVLDKTAHTIQVRGDHYFDVVAMLFVDGLSFDGTLVMTENHPLLKKLRVLVAECVRSFIATADEYSTRILCDLERNVFGRFEFGEHHFKSPYLFVLEPNGGLAVSSPTLFRTLFCGLRGDTDVSPCPPSIVFYKSTHLYNEKLDPACTTAIRVDMDDSFSVSGVSLYNGAVTHDEAGSNTRVDSISRYVSRLRWKDVPTPNSSSTEPPTTGLHNGDKLNEFCKANSRKTIFVHFHDHCDFAHDWHRLHNHPEDIVVCYRTLLAMRGATGSLKPLERSGGLAYYQVNPGVSIDTVKKEPHEQISVDTVYKLVRAPKVCSNNAHGLVAEVQQLMNHNSSLEELVRLVCLVAQTINLPIYDKDFMSATNRVGYLCSRYSTKCLQSIHDLLVDNGSIRSDNTNHTKKSVSEDIVAYCEVRLGEREKPLTPSRSMHEKYAALERSTIGEWANRSSMNQLSRIRTHESLGEDADTTLRSRVEKVATEHIETFCFRKTTLPDEPYRPYSTLGGIPPSIVDTPPQITNKTSPIVTPPSTPKKQSGAVQKQPQETVPPVKNSVDHKTPKDHTTLTAKHDSALEVLRSISMEDNVATNSTKQQGVNSNDISGDDLLNSLLSI